MVESAHVPPFWHGIESQDEVPPAAAGSGSGSGVRVGSASHVKPCGHSAFGGPCPKPLGLGRKRAQSTHVAPGLVYWHGFMSIVQSSSVVSQFKPYQCRLHVQEYVPGASDTSVVESAHVPLFWHGDDAHGDTSPAVGSGDGVVEAPASHV